MSRALSPTNTSRDQQAPRLEGPVRDTVDLSAASTTSGARDDETQRVSRALVRVTSAVARLGESSHPGANPFEDLRVMTNGTAQPLTSKEGQAAFAQQLANGHVDIFKANYDAGRKLSNDMLSLAFDSNGYLHISLGSTTSGVQNQFVLDKVATPADRVRLVAGVLTALGQDQADVNTGLKGSRLAELLAEHGIVIVRDRTNLAGLDARNADLRKFLLDPVIGETVKLALKAEQELEPHRASLKNAQTQYEEARRPLTVLEQRMEAIEKDYPALSDRLGKVASRVAQEDQALKELRAEGGFFRGMVPSFLRGGFDRLTGVDTEKVRAIEERLAKLREPIDPSDVSPRRELRELRAQDKNITKEYVELKKQAAALESDPDFKEHLRQHKVHVGQRSDFVTAREVEIAQMKRQVDNYVKSHLGQAQFVVREKPPEDAPLIEQVLRRNGLPVDKADKIISTYDFKQKLDLLRAQGHDINFEPDGSITLERERKGVTERLTFSPRRDGRLKVTLEQRGQEPASGRMWTDDALEATNLFLEGKKLKVSLQPKSDVREVEIRDPQSALTPEQRILFNLKVGETVTVGRNPSNDLQMYGAGVSGNHCMIKKIAPDTYQIIDRKPGEDPRTFRSNSKNGTAVNNVRIRYDGENPGEIIVRGGQTITFGALGSPDSQSIVLPSEPRTSSATESRRAQRRAAGQPVDGSLAA